MRDDKWQVQEERPTFVRANEVEGNLSELVLGIRLATQRLAVVPLEVFLDAVAPEEARIVIVGMPLTVVAVEEVKTLAVGVAGIADLAQPPLAGGARGV